MKESDVRSESSKGPSDSKHDGFKKKGGKFKKQQSPGKEFFKGVGFYICRKGPELFSKTIEILGLYISTQFKNGSDIKKCLMQEKLVKPAVKN